MCKGDTNIFTGSSRLSLRPVVLFVLLYEFTVGDYKQVREGVGSQVSGVRVYKCSSVQVLE